MTAENPQSSSPADQRRPTTRWRNPFYSIKVFVFCHGLLQLAQLLVSGYLKSSISTIEKRYGLSSQTSGLLASFNEVGNTVLIVFVSFFGSRVHRPRFIGGGACIASLAGILMALPHLITERYEYDQSINNHDNNSTDICQLDAGSSHMEQSHHNCSARKEIGHEKVLPIMFLGQLLLGIGGVPIQPFGISYIDDYASKRNSPLYIGILFAITVIGPAVAFLLGSFMLRIYVDIDKIPFDKIVLKNDDPRWVGAWWLGFLLAACLLALACIPYFFFPREMPEEQSTESTMETRNSVQEKNSRSDPLKELSLPEFMKSFPKIMLRTLRNPIYLLVVLAQVNLSAMVAGLATFMAKFLEKQFTKTASFANMMIGGINIPCAVLGIVAGGAIMKRLRMSVKTSALMSTFAVFSCVLLAIPLLFLGCPTQKVDGIYPKSNEQGSMSTCFSNCSCQEHAFNPVCGSNGVEYRSPCHAGCRTINMDTEGLKVLNYSGCTCISVHPSKDYAYPGSCGTNCSNFFIPFMILSALTGFVASFSQTPSFMMVLRTVPPEDKSLALGIQFMLFRVLAWMPGPVLYGSAIDTTCILWGKNCQKKTSCHYYDLDLFRHRYLGLQVFFEIGAFLCFLMVFLILRNLKSLKEEKEKQAEMETKEKSLEAIKAVKEPLMDKSSESNTPQKV
ncbi:solute carrier organic anion transporter family member 2B1 [Lepisosteus oculatus]|uniref:solute carrier organic anion transporter family member 2B1 n=1 Tax=Lepisosteus oculatus TaxID=7918 RepID=UPI003721B8BE